MKRAIISGRQKTRASAITPIRKAKRRVAEAQIPPHPAFAADLRHVTDQEPGFKRAKRGKGFVYLDSDKRPVTDADELARIRALVIPPAWKDVWICAYADGHIQCTGIDARGRKQYRYHPNWSSYRDREKFDRVLQFAAVLPDIRAQVQADLRKRGLNRRRVLATVVALLEETFIRVGNESYARENESFGLTTLRNHHVSVSKCRVDFSFRGKSGVFHTVSLQNCGIASIIRNCHDLPGELLFQYLDTSGAVRSVRSADVNNYIKEISGASFTAKDFRTWAGTLLAARQLGHVEIPSSLSKRKRIMTATIKDVAAQLGNTPAVCRKCYIHPAILDGFMDGKAIHCEAQDPPATGLSCEEKELVKFLTHA